MNISIELDQTWDETKDLLNYLRSLSRIIEGICESGEDAPTDWFFHIEEMEGEYTISLTHL